MASSGERTAPWRAFDAAWFARHQRRILALLNGRWTRGLARWALRLTQAPETHGRAIAEIRPDMVRVTLPDGQQCATFHTHAKYGKRVYYALAPLWWALHCCDWLVLDRLLPALSFGLATLTAYPQAGSGGANVTCDGSIRNYVGSPVSWANFRGATLYTVVRNFTGTSNYAGQISRTAGTAPRWEDIYRAFYTFNTSTIGAGQAVSAATLSLRGYNSNEDGITGDDSLAVVAFTPANMNTVTDAEFNAFGTTSFASIAFADFKTWENINVLTFNAAGIAHIKMTAPTGVGTEIGADATNTEPGGTTAGEIFYQVYNADNTGTTNDPKLTVTYAAAASTATYSPGAILVL